MTQKIINLLKSKWLWRIIIVFFLIAPFIVKISTLNMPYWFDEANTIWYINQNIERMIEFTINDFSPPLYYILLHFWVKIFGDSEIATGCLSLIFNTISIGLVYLLAKKLFNKEIGIISALMFSGAISSVIYAAETRMYSLVALLSILSVYFLWNSIKTNKKKQWIAYIFFTALGFYAHYSFLFLIIAQNIFIILFFNFQKYFKKPIFKSQKWIIIQFIIFIISLPWLKIFIERVIDTQFISQSYWTGVTSPLTLFPLSHFLKILLNSTIYTPEQTIIALSAEVIIITLILFGIFKIKINLQNNNLNVKIRKETLKIIYISLLTFIPIFILTFTKIDELKYITYIVPLLCIILSKGIYHIKNQISKMLLLTLILSIILYSAAINSSERAKLHHYSLQWKNLTNYIKNSEGEISKEMILINPYEVETVFNYYYKGKLKTAGFLPKKDGSDIEINKIKNIGKFVILKDNIQEIRAFIGDYKIIWFIATPHRHIYDPYNLTEEWLQKNCRLLDIKHFPEENFYIDATTVSKYKCK